MKEDKMYKLKEYLQNNLETSKQMIEDIINKNIEHRHGNGGNQFPGAQQGCIAFQASGTQSYCARNQMKGVSSAQYDGHHTEKTELLLALAFPNHSDAESDHSDQINCVK